MRPTLEHAPPPQPVEGERGFASPRWMVAQHPVLNGVAGELREADRAARNAASAPASVRPKVLSLQAVTASLLGSVDLALEILDELHKIPDHELTPLAAARAAASEANLRNSAGQYYLAEVVGRKAIPLVEKIGDLWGRADLVPEFIAPLYLGRPKEAHRLILEAIPRAARLGHDNAKFIALCPPPIGASSTIDSQNTKGIDDRSQDEPTGRQIHDAFAEGNEAQRACSETGMRRDPKGVPKWPKRPAMAAPQC